MTQIIKQRRRTKRRKLRATHFQTVALLIVLTVSLALNMIQIVHLVFPEEIMIYGDLNFTYTDDKVCINTGSRIMKTAGYICCNAYPLYTTRNITSNLTYDTTQCLKIDKIRYQQTPLGSSS